MDIIDYKLAGSNMRNRRTQLGMTQEKVANSSGIDTSFYSHIENGSRKAGLKTFFRISKTLNITIDALINDDGNNGADIQIEQIVRNLKQFNEKERAFVMRFVEALKAFRE